MSMELKEENLMRTEIETASLEEEGRGWRGSASHCPGVCASAAVVADVCSGSGDTVTVGAILPIRDPTGAGR